MIKRVLVVDGDRNIAASISLLLQRAGMQVSIAHDVATAQAAIQLATPDLVLLESRLPDRSGCDLCQWIRAEPHLSAVRVVFISARARDADIAKAHACGADGFLVKPFSAQDLMEQLEALA